MELSGSTYLINGAIFLFILAVLFFIAIPLIFMNSIKLQRLLMFTNLNLPNKQSYYEKYELKIGLRNLYVSVKDKDSNAIMSLGVWHLLPHSLKNEAITEQDIDFDKALKYSNKSVLLYFHGKGEDRSSSLMKYKIFRNFFHVITFDYRSYGDSTNGVLSEDAVVNDCVQLYEWLSNKTLAPIFFWGHSLGTALATKTVMLLRSQSPQLAGLVLEAPFTKMSDEICVHPCGKIFAWLPWFKATVIKPLEKNGFIFDTSKNISNIQVPIMILTAEDDSVVPYHFGKELYIIANNRSGVHTTVYHQFPYNLGHGHNFIYQNPSFPNLIKDFQCICTKNTRLGSVIFKYNNYNKK